MKLILSYIILSWVGDASVSYQLSFQDPAITTMEGIYLFNLHLLFVIIGIVVVVGWLLHSILLNFTEFNQSNVSNFVHSTVIKNNGSTILAFILFSLGSSSLFSINGLDEILNVAFILNSFSKNLKKKLSHYLSEFSNLLFTNKFDLFFILLGLIFFCLKVYVFSVYSIVTVVYYRFLAHRFPTWDNGKLSLEHSKIEKTSYDNITIGSFEVFIVISLITLSLIYSTRVGILYVIFLLVGATFKYFGIEATKYFPKLFQRFKQCKKDFCTLKYHWYKDFRAARDIIYISIISLVTCIVLAIIQPYFIELSNDIIELNSNIWFVAFTVHISTAFLIDSYIIFFANMPLDEKTIVFCARCASYIAGVTYSNQQLTENGWVAPNAPSNKIREFQGLPRAVDHEQIIQHRTMVKYYPSKPISEYTYTQGNITSVDTPKILNIAQNDKDYLLKSCNDKELRAFRLQAPTAPFKR